MTPDFSSPSKLQDAGRVSSRSLLPDSAADSEADSLAGLHEVRARGGPAVRLGCGGVAFCLGELFRTDGGSATEELYYPRHW